MSTILDLLHASLQYPRRVMVVMVVFIFVQNLAGVNALAVVSIMYKFLYCMFGWEMYTSIQHELTMGI